MKHFSAGKLVECSMCQKYSVSITWLHLGMHELSEFKTSCDIIIEMIEIENNSPWRWYDVIKAAKGLKQTDDYVV